MIDFAWLHRNLYFSTYRYPNQTKPNLKLTCSLWLFGVVYPLQYNWLNCPNIPYLPSDGQFQFLFMSSSISGGVMNEAAALLCFTLGQGDPLGPEKSLHTNLTTQRDGREGKTPPEMDDSWIEIGIVHHLVSMVCSDNSINFISLRHPSSGEVMNVEQGHQWGT